MKKNIHGKIFIIVTIVLLALSSKMVGAYELTARSFGMGGAFSAIADDVETVLYNPAGMADAGTVGLNFSAGITASDRDGLEELTEIEDNINNNDISDILGAISSDVGLTGQVFFGAKLNSLGLVYNIKDELSVDYDDQYYSNEMISEGIISYGNTLLEPPFDLGTLSYGLNVKLINVSRESYDVKKNIERKAKGSGYGLDLGALAKVTDNLRLACVVENVLVSDITIKGEEREYKYNGNSWESTVLDSSNSDEKELDLNVRVGAAFRVPVIDLTLAADIDNFFDNNGSGQVYHFGLEKNLFFNGFSIRAGKITGDEVDLTTLGLGLNLSGFNLDLALGKGDRDNDLSALLSASMNF